MIQPGKEDILLADRFSSENEFLAKMKKSFCNSNQYKIDTFDEAESLREFWRNFFKRIIYKAAGSDLGGSQQEKDGIWNHYQLAIRKI